MARVLAEKMMTAGISEGRGLPRVWCGLPQWILWLGPLLLGSAVLRVLVAVWSDPISTPDTGDYMKLARQLGSIDFSQYTGSRTPGYPLFLLITGLDPFTVRAVQESAGLATVALLFYVGWSVTRSYEAATLLGAWYGLSAVQIRYENTVLSECLTTLGIALTVALLVGLRLDRGRPARGRLILLGLSASVVGLVRPAYIFLPAVLLIALVLSRKLHAGGLLSYSVPAFLPMVMWSLVNLALLGSFSPTTTTGYSLTNHSGPIIGYADDQYSEIKSVYLAARQQYGDMPKNLIWRPGVISEMMARTGLSFAQLSTKLTRMSLELFSAYPLAYAQSFSRSTLEIWNPESFAKWGGMHNRAAEDALSMASRLERWLGIGLNLAFFLLLAGSVLMIAAKRRRVIDANTMTIASIVILAAIVQSAIEMAEKRYGVPLQPLTAILVLTLVCRALPRRLVGAEPLPPTGLADAGSSEQMQTIS